MEEESAQKKRKRGRRTGPEEKETWKKNRPRRRGQMEEAPAQEKKRDGRKPGPGEEEE